MLYNYESSFENAKRRIKELSISENAVLINEFLKLLSAEGLSKPRILKYANHLIVIARKMNNPFKNIERKDVINFLSCLEQSNYSPHTISDYKGVLRRFFRFLGKEDMISDIKTTLKNSKKKLPEELLTEKEVKRMIEVATHPRNKVIIALLYEGGLRIGELASLQLKNIEFDEYGTVIKVKGKTGERRVRLVLSSSLLAKWIEMHPYKDTSDAPLLINLSTNYKKIGITHRGISNTIKRIAEKAGVKKHITPHLFRHSRATHLATHLTEAEMNEYFGWVQGSDMPATYVHLSGRDIDDKILQIHGLKPRDKDRESELRPKECPRCKYINSPTDRFCSRCGAILDEEEMVKLQMKSKRLAKDFSDLALEDPKLLLEMKKFVELIELFEKKPELFNKMKGVIEERT